MTPAARMKPPPGPSHVVPPKQQWGTTDLPPRPFSHAALTDFRIVQARCTDRHCRWAGFLWLSVETWEQAQTEERCPRCGKRGGLEAVV